MLNIVFNNIKKFGVFKNINLKFAELNLKQLNCNYFPKMF